MIDSYFRRPYQALAVDPVANFLAKRTKILPESLTMVALIVGTATTPCLFFGYTRLAFISLLISGYLDTLDGTLARKVHRASPRGAVLDIISDRVVEFATIYGIFLVDPQHRGCITMLMLGSVLVCITSFLVVGIFTANDSEKSFYYSPGMMERTEAFLFFGFMILWPEAFTILGSAFIFLVFITALRRVIQFLKSDRSPALECESAVQDSRAHTIASTYESVEDRVHHGEAQDHR